MSKFTSFTQDITAKLIKETVQQTENAMLEQLGHLVTQGFLVWEETQPILIREENINSHSFNFKLTKLGRFKLKDQEYIERLEKENEELKGD